MSLMIIKCLNVKQQKNRAGEGSEKGKIELTMKWLHNIGAGHTVEKFNFNRKMVCQHHVIVDLEHRLLGLGIRRQVNEDIAPTEFINRKKSPGPSSVAMACEERSRKRDKHNVCKYYKWATRI